MSFVLDALRRAEADRHRGEVPDLHVPAAAGVAGGPAQAAGPPTSWRRRALVLILLVAVLVGVWGWVSFTSPRPVPAVARMPASGAVAPVAAATEPAPTRVVPPPVALPEPTPPRRQAPAAGTPSAELPPLIFGGAFDSPDPKARMLIINGQVWREGDEPAPGLVLERISLHAAQFRFRGRSFELAYDGPRPMSTRP